MNTTANTTTITADDAAAWKGSVVTLHMGADDLDLTGTLISVNSKGWNVQVDGKTISRGLNRVHAVTTELDADLTATVMADADMEADMYDECGDPDMDAITDADALVAELDGATTADLAAVFGIEAKALRVHLRALGLGVGKGHRYHLAADDIAKVTARLAG